MKRSRIGIIAGAIIIIIAELTTIDYSHWNWSENLGPSLVIIGLVFIISSVLSNKNYKK